MAQRGYLYDEVKAALGGARSVEYTTLEEYAARRAASLSGGEKRGMLACLAYTTAFRVLKRLLADKKGKLGTHLVYEIRNDMGVMGAASASIVPVFFVRRLPVGEATRLFRASTCLGSMRRPATVYQLLEGYAPAVAFLAASFAAHELRLMETLTRASGGSLAARLHYKLRKRLYDRLDGLDVFRLALERCLAKMTASASKWPLLRDLSLYVAMGEPLIALADGVPDRTLLVEPLPTTCPSVSLTIAKDQDDYVYVAHAFDLAV